GGPYPEETRSVGLVFVAAIAAQKAEPRLAVVVARVERALLGAGETAPLEGNARRSAPGENGPRARRLGGYRSGGPGRGAGRAIGDAGKVAGGVPVGRRGNRQVSGAIGHQVVRGDRSRPGSRIIESEEQLRAGLQLGGFPLVAGRRAGRRVGRRGFEAQDL